MGKLAAMDINNKTIFVIGGSGVLGQEMARQLLSKGAHVVASARSETSLNRIPSGVESTCILDLSQSESITSAAQHIATTSPAIDAIVNCSGLVGFGTIAETSASDAVQLMQVNHLGPAHLITLLLPQLLQACEAHGEAMVVGITGVVAERSFPGLAAYGESKLAASRHLAALAQEFRRVKLKTLDARPGHTETGLASRPLFGIAPQFPTGMSPEHVVGKIIEAIELSKTELASTDF